jgi:hypothetical protein
MSVVYTTVYARVLHEHAAAGQAKFSWKEKQLSEWPTGTLIGRQQIPSGIATNSGDKTCPLRGQPQAACTSFRHFW